MNHPWTPEMEARFRIKTKRETEQACRLAALLALTFFPSFSFIDWFAQHEHIQILNEIRYVGVGCFLVIYLIIRKRKHWNPYYWAVALLSIAAFDITCMTLALDGYRSPYYAGVNLVILGAGLILPWGARQMGMLTAWFCMLYLLPVLIQARFQIDDLPIFVNNAAFVISTALIATASAFFWNRLRRESFAQFVEAADARTRAENTLREKNEVTEALEMRDEFISIASHELKTPITVLKLQNDLLSRSLERVPVAPDVQEGIRKHFSRANNQLNSLIRLINDMLDLSRISSGKMEFSFGIFEIGELIRDVTERLQESMDENGIRLVLELQPNLIATVDRVRFEQVLTNLINNAVKYAPGTPLRIRLREQNGAAVIEVEDEGPGIPVALQPLVFDRFQRGDSNHKIGGLGLGLYIAQQIMIGLRGTIVIVQKPSSGAFFRIEFPLGLNDSSREFPPR